MAIFPVDPALESVVDKKGRGMPADEVFVGEINFFIIHAFFDKIGQGIAFERLAGLVAADPRVGQKKTFPPALISSCTEKRSEYSSSLLISASPSDLQAL